MSNQYDVIVIGGGPGGYEAAIKAAQEGFSVACIEKRVHKNKPSLGGTCLNVGCIPSKALLDSSHRYHSTQHELASHGIEVPSVGINVSAMQSRKDKIVDQLTTGVAALLKGNGITWLQGSGQLDANKTVIFNPLDNGPAQIFQPKFVILATGSQPIELSSMPIDGTYVVDSTGALEFTEVPNRLAIIGAGVIGLELGSVWARLGAQVTVFEATEQFLPMLDKMISKDAFKTLSRQGLMFSLGTKVVSSKINIEQKNVQLSIISINGPEEVTFDRVIVCVGRKPYTTHLATNESGLLFDEKGFVSVNDHCETNIPGVFAIGDIVRGPMLAHKAMEEGVMAVERMKGHQAQVNYQTISNVIYTEPEIAWVGLSEQQAIDAGYTVKTGHFAFAVNGRSLASSHTDGLVRMVSDDITDRILGVQIIGTGAGDMIHQAMIALEFGATTEDIQRMTFAHPTQSEAFHEAALSVDGIAIHAIQRKKK